MHYERRSSLPQSLRRCPRAREALKETGESWGRRGPGVSSCKIPVPRGHAEVTWESFLPVPNSPNTHPESRPSCPPPPLPSSVSLPQIAVEPEYRGPDQIFSNWGTGPGQIAAASHFYNPQTPQVLDWQFQGPGTDSLWREASVKQAQGFCPLSPTWMRDPNFVFSRKVPLQL